MGVHLFTMQWSGVCMITIPSFQLKRRQCIQLNNGNKLHSVTQ